MLRFPADHPPPAAPIFTPDDLRAALTRCHGAGASIGALSRVSKCSEAAIWRWLNTDEAIAERSVRAARPWLEAGAPMPPPRRSLRKPSPGREALIAAGVGDPTLSVHMLSTRLHVHDETLIRWLAEEGLEMPQPTAAREARLRAYVPEDDSDYAAYLRSLAGGRKVWHHASTVRHEARTALARRLGHMDDAGALTVAGLARVMQPHERTWLMDSRAVAKIGIPLPSGIGLRLAKVFVGWGILESRPMAGRVADLTPLGEALAAHLRAVRAAEAPPEPAVEPGPEPSAAPAEVSPPSEQARRRAAERAALGWDV